MSVDTTFRCRPPSIHGRTRGAFIAGVASIAIVQGVFGESFVAMPWAASVVWGLIGAATSVAGWWLLFAPAWLPMLVPPKYPRVSRAAFGLCGLILLLVGGVIGFLGAEMMLYGEFTLLAPYGLLALATGVYFLWLAIHRDASFVER